jgi:hypothetical protein
VHSCDLFNTCPVPQAFHSLQTSSATLFISLPFLYFLLESRHCAPDEHGGDDHHDTIPPPLDELVALRILRGRRPRVSSVAPLRLGAQ